MVSGAGAAAISCMDHYQRFGVKREHITLCDSKGVVYKGRTSGMNPWKEAYAQETTARTLADVMKGCDVFLGLSVKGQVTKEMVASMAPNPIIFAMANPDPEITPEEAHSARADLIMATGRSDYPNQINNVLAFPGIFRGALDVRARRITEGMKLAAAQAIADVITPEELAPEYIVPSVFNRRVVENVALAVAEAAQVDGVARRHAVPAADAVG